ncbi:MAG: hypothetical protein LUH36_00205, partial [Oscillospiraceae bacterium]|nr:hypothetical protein [Oscillospiraceae bacterium]
FGAIARLSVKSVSEKELRSMERNICRESAHSMNGSLRHFLSLLLSMYEEFEANKMFAESDVCLYMIRRVNIRIKKTARDKNKLRRAFNMAYCSLVQLVIEHCFGWGIRVINNVVTMLCMISAFAVSYFISALRTASGISPFICFETAVNRFFLGCVYDDPYQFFLYFDSLESIIGVIMLTVFTGVLVRKIIR